jgi:orotate phosphoribosyltransferase
MADIRTHDDIAERARAILELSERLGALKFGEFKLSSGGTSHYYFDGRLVTLDPEGAYLVARAFLPLLRECKAEAVAGPALAAVPIVSSIALMSYTDGDPISGLIVRQEVKGHGTKRTIEGSLREGARVVVVDDACSTGGSLIHAIEAVEAAGCEVVRVICILDRRSGGSDAIRQRGYDFVALLEANEKGEIGPAAS